MTNRNYKQAMARIISRWLLPSMRCDAMRLLTIVEMHLKIENRMSSALNPEAATASSRCARQRRWRQYQILFSSFFVCFAPNTDEIPNTIIIVKMPQQCSTRDSIISKFVGGCVAMASTRWTDSWLLLLFFTPVDSIVAVRVMFVVFICSFISFESEKHELPSNSRENACIHCAARTVSRFCLFLTFSIHLFAAIARHRTSCVFCAIRITIIIMRRLETTQYCVHPSLTDARNRAARTHEVNKSLWLWHIMHIGLSSKANDQINSRIKLQASGAFVAAWNGNDCHFPLIPFHGGSFISLPVALIIVIHFTCASIISRKRREFHV